MTRKFQSGFIHFARAWGTLLVALLLASALSGPPAKAATPYQGIYTVIDPYNPPEIANLQSAAQTSCAQNQQQVTTPFCGASNGILLRIPWCAFQLYHVNDTQGQPYPSCHYFVGYSGAIGSSGVQLTLGDETSPCAGIYDICAGQTRSILGTTLRYIVQINKQRATAGLPPLLLSVGMFAGIGTPQAMFDANGYVDVPHSNNAINPQASEECYRQPLAWKAPFVTAYEQAFDQLLTYIQSQFPPGPSLNPANIVIVKPAGISATDLEVEMHGAAAYVPAPVDPGPGGPGPGLNCQVVVNGANIGAATVWLSTYNQNPNANQNFSDAIESTFGGIIGHLWATLNNMGLGGTLVSIATTNGDAFAEIDCGVSGASACSVQPLVTGQWSVYYLMHYIQDIFDGGLAYSQAQAAYAALRNDTFSLPPTQLSVDSTALSPNAITPLTQISCILNNTNPAQEITMSLNGSPTPILGVGTIVGWQTATNQGVDCATGSYDTALQNGVQNGGLFIEIETDAAFTYISQCSPYLTTALTNVMAVPAAANCAY